MKHKILNLIGIIAILAIIGLGFAACGGGGDDPFIPGGTDPCASKHDYPAWTAPTCTVAGNSERTCTRCGNADKRATGFTALGHDWEYAEGAILPACEEEGHGTRTCLRTGCGEVEEDMDFDALGHNWNNWHATIIPNCVEIGEEQRECQRCDKTEDRELPVEKNEHDLEAAEGGLAPTCLLNGHGSVRCKRDGCDYTATGSVLNARGHHFEDNWTEKTPATCIAAKVEERFCTHECGETGNSQTRSVGGYGDHVWGNDAVTAPRCTEEGYTTQTCSSCYDPSAIREITIDMWDINGIGWDGSDALRINVNGVDKANIRVPTNASNSKFTFTVSSDDRVDIYWVVGSGQEVNFYAMCYAFAVYYSDDPPNPTFNPDSNSWSASNDPNGKVLVYRQYITMYSVSNNTLLGSFKAIKEGEQRIDITSSLGHDWNWATYTSGIRNCQRGSCSVIVGIGDQGPAGGRIFYVAPSGFTVQGYGSQGDNGYFAEYTAHYLEAAPANATESISWLSGSNTSIPNLSQNNNSTDKAIGRGRMNTAIIIAALSYNTTTNNAAKAAAAYINGGKDDWFLPSINELKEMYNARTHLGLSSEMFWSSSQYSGGWAWSLSFINGNQYNEDGINTKRRVRAIRAF